MTETISPVPEQIDTQQLAQRLVERARVEGVDLVGPGGLLTGLTKTVLETALDGRWPSTSAMTSTTRPAATARTRATAPDHWAMRWKPALNAFAITFAGRILPSGLN